VASFFVSRVDTEVDRRLEAFAAESTPGPLALQGRAAVAQAKLAYHLFRLRFSGPRWERLVARGARLQRPLWASTSTKDPRLPDTLYVDNLIGPATVNTMPEATIAAFEDHGRVARTVDVDVENAMATMDRLAEARIDMEFVRPGVADAGHEGAPTRRTLSVDWVEAVVLRLVTTLTCVMMIAVRIGRPEPVGASKRVAKRLHT
jgi:transaldolase